MLHGNGGLGCVSMVMHVPTDFGGGVGSVASQQTVTAEGPCTTVAEEPAEGERERGRERDGKGERRGEREEQAYKHEITSV